MEGELKSFEELLKLMPSGWEEKARKRGALTRARNVKITKDLLPVNFLYLTITPSFGKTAAVLRLDGGLRLNKNAVYERISTSGAWLEWLGNNICRACGLVAEKPCWLGDRRGLPGCQR